MDNEGDLIRFMALHARQCEASCTVAEPTDEDATEAGTWFSLRCVACDGTIRKRMHVMPRVRRMARACGIPDREFERLIRMPDGLPVLRERIEGSASFGSHLLGALWTALRGGQSPGNN
jgi:hypothetical protein